MMAHIHHVQIWVQNGAKYLQKFTQSANFQLFATRKSTNLKQWAVRSGSIIFVINDTTRGDSSPWMEKSSGAADLTKTEAGPDIKTSEPLHSSAVPDQCFLEPPQFWKGSSTAHRADSQARQRRATVFNIAFEVGDVTAVFTRAERNGAKVLCRPTVVGDSANGHVTVAAMQSCVGNVVHMLIDSSNYDGVFLPGFVAAGSDSSLDEPVANQNASEVCKASSSNTGLPTCLTSHIDHVTFACPLGSSSEVLEWYERCFGMKRFMLMSGESEADGFIVQGQNVGLRMKAMEYWHCAETGLMLPAVREKGEVVKRPRPPKAKFVLAEALPGQGPNQVETFLQQHGGAGIQHIGLHTHNIIQAVSCLRQSGLSFISPPPAYYSQAGKLTEISHIRDDVAILQGLGILLDEESSPPDDKNGQPWKNEGDVRRLVRDGTPQCRYLMQVFTKPLFERDTFFLEIIQRHGATGFGAGNIRALWRAVQSFMSYNDR